MNKQALHSEPKEETLLNGTIERIIYFNEENDYSVVRFFPENEEESRVAVGHLGGVQPGENFQFSGEWVTDPRFGEQFKVNKFRIIYPTTEKGIINFLSSGMISGIGKGYASRIVAKFGPDTIRIISEEPERLKEVKGLGERRIDALIASWKEHYAVRDIMMFLQGYGISAAFASRIFKQYGFDSIEILKTNPYRLATEVSGIGFLSADRISKSIGISEDSPMRIDAGIVYVLGKLTEEGHVFCPEAKLLEEAVEILKNPLEPIKDALERLLVKGSLFRQQTSKGETAIYLSSLLKAENGVVEHFKRLLLCHHGYSIPDPSQLVAEEEGKGQIAFSEAQKKAIELGLREKALVITGGPGTGKTTIIKTLVDLYKNHGIHFLLAAPTGRASKRLSESTGCETKTIHRLLEYNPKFNTFTRNDGNPLDADAVIIDEASMIDILLMYHLLEALPDKSILILVGDVDQLPSVGPGKVLRDVIASERIPTIKLDMIFRQAKGSEIIINAHHINRGEGISLENNKEGNFFFIQKNEPKEVVATIEELVCERIPARFGFDPVKSIQVLTPMHKTDMGVSNLNLILQKRLNPNKRVQVRRHLNIAIGDKVMQTSNNYDKDIFNGDIGFVEHIDEENQIVFVQFDGRRVEFSYGEMEDVILSYAITVHKSQGSEYEAVVLPVTTHHYTMLQRNLLYTAITRGKKLVVLVGSQKALGIAIRNNHIHTRYSDLEEKLKQLKGTL